MVYYCSYSISHNRGSLEMNTNKMKMNGKSDNRNNRTADFDIQKADRDKDGIISDYEATVAKAIAKSMREQNKKKA